MITDEFKELLLTLRGLNHHQRNLTKVALNQQTDLPEVLELLESRFELKPACPHCAGIRLSRCGRNKADSNAPISRIPAEPPYR